MKFILLISFVFILKNSSAQNIGIGTSTPSSNAILDISSTNKGLMLPRLADTMNVVNPTAGLIIYNQHAQTPSFHNGAGWSNLATSSTNISPDDSITYTYAGLAEARALAYNQASYRTIDAVGRPTSIPLASTFTISKKFDANSPTLKNYYYTAFQNSQPVVIKFYKQGNATPYYKVEYTDTYMIRAEDTYSATDGLVETFIFSFRKMQIGQVIFQNQWP